MAVPRREGVEAEQRLIGLGIYTVPEASKLTAVSSGRIKRWLRGYSYVTAAGALRASTPVFTGQLPQIDGALALSFLDLMEVRFVDAFIDQGVSWKTLREAHLRALELIGHHHPFSTGRFRTDGQRVLMDVAEKRKDGALLDIVRSQYGFKRLIMPFLKHLDFSTDAIAQALRWWPLGRSRQVVLDPERSFGQAIVAREGVPTAILARAYDAEARVNADEALTRVARWFEVKRGSVRDAVAWEAKLAA